MPLTKEKQTCASCCCNTEQMWIAINTNMDTRRWCLLACQVRCDMFKVHLRYFGTPLPVCVATPLPLCLQVRLISRGWCWTRGQKRTWSTLWEGRPRRWPPLWVRLDVTCAHSQRVKCTWAFYHHTPLLCQSATFSLNKWMFLLVLVEDRKADFTLTLLYYIFIIRIKQNWDYNLPKILNSWYLPMMLVLGLCSVWSVCYITSYVVPWRC